MLVMLIRSKLRFDCNKWIKNKILILGKSPNLNNSRVFMATKFVEVSKILSYFPKNKIFTTQAYDVFIITLASEVTKI